MGIDKEILTIEEVAEMLNLSKRTIYSLLKEGKLPGTKIGGQWRFSRRVILQMFVKSVQDKNDRGVNKEEVFRNGIS